MVLEQSRADERPQISRLTNDSCTAPQKHVAVASSLVDQPSWANPARGKYGLDLSTAAVVVKGVVDAIGKFLQEDLVVGVICRAVYGARSGDPVMDDQDAER